MSGAGGWVAAVLAVCAACVPAAVGAQAPTVVPAAAVREGAVELTATLGYGVGVDLLQSEGGQRYALPTVTWGRVLTGPRGPAWFRGRFEWAVEVVPLFAQHAPDTAFGAGVSPLVWRWNLEPRGRAAPFGEVGGGALWTTEPVPAGTTRTNFAVHMSAGVRLFGDGHDALLMAYRFDHVSNGNRLSRNPGVNAHMIVVGWSRVRP